MNSINKIGIGTVQFGANYGISNSEGKTASEEVLKILDYAQTNSIQYIDTAFGYGDAEHVIGQYDLSKFKIISKYIPKQELTIEEQLQKSFDRLKINKLYGYLAHRALDLVENDCRNWNILKKLKQQNLVSKIGASFNTVEEAEVILSYNIDLDIIQIPYNYFDHRFESFAIKLKEKGCEVHTRSTFLQGLFFCNPNQLPNFFDEIKPTLRRIQRNDFLYGQLLQYVIKKEFIDVVVIGVNNLSQLKDNIESLTKELEELQLIDGTINHQIITPSEWPKRK